MKVDIITPEHTLFSNNEVKSIIVPGMDGHIEILNNHAPIISLLGKGEITIKFDSNTEKISIKSGLIECLKNNVNVLVEK